MPLQQYRIMVDSNLALSARQANSALSWRALPRASQGFEMRPGPSVHANLAALVTFAVADQQRAAIGVKVGLVERERLADP